MMCLRRLFIRFVFASTLFAAVPAGAANIEYVHGPSQVNIVDVIPVHLNPDGLMDLVSVSITDGQVRAYINQNNLQFEQVIISTEAQGAFRISSADINGDGATDLLMPLFESNEVVLLTRDPLAPGYQFTRTVVSYGVLLPSDVQAGDMNQDGLMDLVSTSFGTGHVFIHYQIPGGAFIQVQLSDQPINARKAVITDLNNDDLLDVAVVSSGDNGLWTFHNTPSQEFITTLVSKNLPEARFVARCDLPGADFPDLVVSAAGSNEIVLFENNQDNTFTPKVIDDEMPTANALSCDQLDADADLELTAVSTTFSAIFKYDLGGSGFRTLISSLRDGYITAQTAIFDDSGQPLIATQSFFEHRVLLYNPSGVNQEQVVWEDFPDGVSYMAFADLDNDTDTDIVYAAFRENTIYWAEKTVSGYVPKVLFKGVDGPQYLSAVDIDQDGDVDVLSAGAWDDTFWLHENQGGGVFQHSPIYTNANNAAAIESADLNGDGTLEMVGTSGLDNSVRIFEKSVSGYSVTVLDNALIGANAVALDDVNDDGLIDVMASGFFSNEIVLYLNLGGLNFQRQVVATDKSKPNTIIATNMGSDSGKDIIFNASHAGSLWRLKNTEAGFTEELIYQNTPNIHAFTVADTDADGDADVVSVSRTTGTTTVSQNTNNSGFVTGPFARTVFGLDHITTMPQAPGEPIQFGVVSPIENSVQIITPVDTLFASGFETISPQTASAHR